MRKQMTSNATVPLYSRLAARQNKHMSDIFKAYLCCCKDSCCCTNGKLEYIALVVMKEGWEKQNLESQTAEAVTKRGKVQQRDLMLYQTMR
jgi:hypothetical protein